MISTRLHRSMESKMKESHKRSRNPAYKTKYRVTNWAHSPKQRLTNPMDITLSTEVRESNKVRKVRKATEVF